MRSKKEKRALVRAHRYFGAQSATRHAKKGQTVLGPRGEWKSESRAGDRVTA